MSAEETPVAPEPQTFEEAAKDATSWKPLYDKILVHRDPPKELTSGGLTIADKYQADQNTGVVLSVGDGRWIDGALYALTVKPGDRVLFSKYAGAPLDLAIPDLIILREDELLAYRKE